MTVQNNLNKEELLVAKFQGMLVKFNAEAKTDLTAVKIRVTESWLKQSQENVKLLKAQFN